MLRSQIESTVRITTRTTSTNGFPGSHIPEIIEQSTRTDFTQWAGDRHTSANFLTDAGQAQGNFHAYLTSDYPWDWILSDEAVESSMEAMSWDVPHH